jgi:drug/metabolite transporter (DMT)-like permease
VVIMAGLYNLHRERVRRARKGPGLPLKHDIRRGAACMLAAMALFTFMSMLVKLASAELHFGQIMFFRSALALPVVLAIVARRRDGALLRTRRLPQQVLRALTGTTAMAAPSSP